MKSDNLILELSFDYALLIVDTYKRITENKKEYVLSRQLLKSGTSIGANVEEAIGAQSTLDFLNKFSIAYKEARETRYWIKLLARGNYLEKEEAEKLLSDVERLCRIIAKIQITTKKKLAKK